MALPPSPSDIQDFPAANFFTPASSRPNSPFPQSFSSSHYPEALQPRNVEFGPLGVARTYGGGAEGRLHSSMSSLGHAALQFPRPGHAMPPSINTVPPSTFTTSPDALSDLLKNRHYQELWSENERMKLQVKRLTERADLLQQVVDQQGEVNRLRKAQLRTSSPGYEPGNTHTPGNPTTVDGIGAAATVGQPPCIIRPIVCPDIYDDNTVLWTRPQSTGENARRDLFYEGNSSRPIMSRCVIKPKGESIGERAYDTLSTMVSTIVTRCLLPLPRNPEEESCCKTFFETRYPKEWAACINEVEQWEPLLRLCAGQWKAIAMVQQRLHKESMTEHQRLSKLSSGSGAVGQSANRRGKRKVQKTSLPTPGNNKRSKTHPTASSFEREESDTARTTLPDQTHPTPTQPAIPRPRSIIPGLDAQISTLGGRSNAATTNTTTSAAATTQTISTVITPSEQAASEKPCGAPQGGAVHVSINFITVSDDVASLRAVFAAHEAESIKTPGLRLLDAIEKSMEVPGSASDAQKQLLLHINSSDPNDPAHSEDDQNESWGHSLFRVGGTQWGDILAHWPGNEYTRQLLAAALKTCKIARHICFERRVDVRTYLSDHYLEMVCSKLWDLWVSAGGVPPVAAQPGATKATECPSRPSGTVNHGSTPGEASMQESDDKGARLKKVEVLLKTLLKDTLKKWCADNGINLGTLKKNPGKKDIVDAILNHSLCLTNAGFESLDALAKSKRNAKGASSTDDTT